MTVAILGVLASVAVPLTRMTSQRAKEIELHRTLRLLRTALDDYKKAYDKAVADNKIVPAATKSGYPEDLQVLVTGQDFGGLYPYKRRFLRRIPIDPMNPPLPGKLPQWGLRSYTDKPGAQIWGGEDVYDVYSLSEGTAIDGSSYKDW